MGTYQHLIANISHRSGDRLQVAALPTYSATIMPRLLRRLSGQHPEVHMQCEILPAPELVDAATLENLDVGIVHYTDAKSEAMAVPICNAPIVLIMPVGQPLARQKAIEANDLKDWPLIGYRRDVPFARIIGESIGAYGVLPNVTLKTIYTSLIRHLVRLGSGIPLVDLFTLMFESPDDLEIRPI